MARSGVLSRSRGIGYAALVVAAGMALAACQPPAPTSSGAPTPGPVSTTASETPAPGVPGPNLSSRFVDRLDGSTATIPLGQAALRALRGTDEGMKFNTTPYAYDNLIAGTKDLILVTYPSQEEFAAAAAAGVELEVVPVVKDALVFLANTANPVSGLTRQQIQDIYTGSVTDWAQVGGAPGAIVPYQRPVGAGSQTLFLKLAMDGVTPMNAPTEMRPAEMSGLVDVVAAMDNGPTALGYSVFYYATQMYLKDTVKLLSVDGVMPSAQTVSDGSYPFGTFYYAVFRKDTPVDSPVRGFVDWLLGDDAQKIAAAADYVPMESRNIVPSAPQYYLGATPENTTVSSGTGGTEFRPLVPMAASGYSCDDKQGTAMPVLTVTGHPEASQAITQWYASRYDPTWTSCYNITVYADLVSVTASRGVHGPNGTVASSNLDGAVFEVNSGRQLGLSDLFFDGANYIAFINNNLLNPWTNQMVRDQQQPTESPDYDGAPGVARPFTGIPRDYVAFELVPWTTQVALQIDFPDGNPFTGGMTDVGYASSARLALPLALSPYGAVWRTDTQYQDDPAGRWTLPVISTGFPAPRATDDAVNATIQAAKVPEARGASTELYGSRLSVLYWNMSSGDQYGGAGDVISLVTVDLTTGKPAPFSEADIPANWWKVPNVSVTSGGNWSETYVPPDGVTYQYVRRNFNTVEFQISEPAPSGRVLQVSVPV